MKKHLYLIGFMGAGKSTVGKLLAETLNVAFVDLDSVIEREQQSTIGEIFQQKGASFFRQLETDAIHNISQEKPAVIALGGGAIQSENNLKVIKESGILIYLNVSLLTLINRLKNDRLNRPIIAQIPHEELNAFIENLLSERVGQYKKADLFVPNESKEPIKVVESIVKDLVKLNF